MPMQKINTWNLNNKSGTLISKNSRDCADIAIEKYAMFDNKVQLLKVTNFDSPTGYVVISSHPFIVITHIFPAPIFTM